MMVAMQNVGDDFSLPAECVPNTTNTCFAALYASKLLHEFLSVCALISTFWSFVLKFTLMRSYQCQKYQMLNLLTGSVERESNVPKRRIIAG